MWAVLLVNLVGLASPGPDFFYVSRKAASDTTPNAIAGAAGIGIGVWFWATIAVFGLSVLNDITPLSSYIIMCLGGAYLAYSGIKMLQITQNTSLQLNGNRYEQRTNLVKEIGKGLMINLSNGKVVVFFTSVLSGFAAQINSPLESYVVIFLLGVETFLYFCLIAFFFSRKLVRDFYTKYTRYIDNFAGVIFLLFGADLIYQGIVSIFSHL
ncbi:LysE family transporter [Exercitatus varius]|uniref:LysE family transporter n=1 Tax=Exercitatus varius TaxID=67857 RepID=UPI0018A5D41C|nr:LysE family transporter [Exercitatus varius]MDG2944138.1 LysE family transporter [Exercitatus varius]MDG2947890.1 LysE family transporter [Exercitatus varius]MDG2957872.1 LysE family transporter [Exercitatus varius]QOF68554.1 LysE family transporter [Actinobacillus sp. GY-402]